MNGPKFELVEDWYQPPTGINHKDVAGVAVDSEGRIHLHTRLDDQVLIYDEDGHFLDAWGLGVFGNAHGIAIGPDDSVYSVDNGHHVVRKFSSEGELLLTLGTPGVPSDTGFSRDVPNHIHHNATIERAAGPFNGCTNLAIAPNGDLYVADGYGNARVHHYSLDGTLLQSWGEIGVGPGEFHLPHGIAYSPDDRVIVADRENDRLQFFSSEGQYLDVWTDVQRPTHLVVDDEGYIYVAELWRPCEEGQASFVHGLPKVDLPGRVSIFDPAGRVVSRWGADSENRAAPGNFIAPHGIALDADGNLYVSEVTNNFGVKPGRLSSEFADHQIQKFHRL